MARVDHGAAAQHPRSSNTGSNTAKVGDELDDDDNCDDDDLRLPKIHSNPLTISSRTRGRIELSLVDTCNG